MFDAFKNTLNNAVQQVTKAVVAPPSESAFLTKGILTPQEYVQAGDKLISIAPSWRWFKAVDNFDTKYLPKDKQFLGIENIVCKQRVKDLIQSANMLVKEGEDGDILICKPEVQVETQGLQQIEQTQSSERYYTLYVIYDLYYFTPRLYLQGKDENGNPLTYDQVKEDIMVEYADKTVTNEHHPHLNIYLPTIHPCKHADTLLFLTNQMIENGSDKSKIHADNSLLLFLKFMGSVIPTVNFDFVAAVIIG